MNTFPPNPTQQELKSN